MRRRNNTHHLPPGSTERVVKLLRETDVSMANIAKRFGISPAAVGLINDREGIRQYERRRVSWLIGGERFPK